MSMSQFDISSSVGTSVDNVALKAKSKLQQLLLETLMQRGLKTVSEMNRVKVIPMKNNLARTPMHNETAYRVFIDGKYVFTICQVIDAAANPWQYHVHQKTIVESDISDLKGETV